MTSSLLSSPAVPGTGATLQRSAERLRAHYEIERELAERLRSAPRAERLSLYSACYDELFRRVPDHPQLARPVSARERQQEVELQMRVLRPYLRPSATLVEIGPGDCALSLQAAREVRRVIGVDVSAEITRRTEWPANFSLQLSDGVSVPVPVGSADVVYSHQLMEHLHPDDALEQLRHIVTALAPGGAYVCVTPSRLTGPHDVSRYFDDRARGLHLREYTAGELHALFRAAGFDRVDVVKPLRGRIVRVPWPLVRAVEAVMARARRPGKAAWLDRPPFRWLSNLNVVGWRAAAAGASAPGAAPLSSDPGSGS